MVIKEVRPYIYQWRDPVAWRDRRPMEIRIHQIIDESRAAAAGLGHENLAEHRGYRLMMRQRRYRIYLEYYEGGDLCDAINPGFIPEGFIWRVLESLLTACQILHFGRAGNAPGAAHGWRPITHLDIKAENIFLQPSAVEGEVSRYCPSLHVPHHSPKQFPTLVLSDFGLAMYPMDPAPQVPGAAPVGPAQLQDNPSEYVFNVVSWRCAPVRTSITLLMHGLLVTGASN